MKLFPNNPLFRSISNAVLDEIAIWNRALTRAEIRSHARNGLTGLESNLTGYWNFDDGIGRDLSPNGKDAELPLRR